MHKKIFKQLYINHKYSISNSHYYLTAQELKNFSLFTFKELNECFKLGYKEAKNHFKKLN